MYNVGHHAADSLDGLRFRASCGPSIASVAAYSSPILALYTELRLIGTTEAVVQALKAAVGASMLTVAPERGGGLA